MYTLTNVGTAKIFRLGISYPELTEMQARAIFEAAIAMSNQGVEVFPEIMVPLVGTPQACIFFIFVLMYNIVSLQFKMTKSISCQNCINSYFLYTCKFRLSGHLHRVCLPPNSFS